MKKMSLFILLLFLISFVPSCNSNTKNKLAKEQKKFAANYNTLLNEAPLKSIQITFDNSTIIPVNKKNKITPSQNSKSIIGEPVGLIRLNDSLYIADKDQSSIIVIDEKRQISRKIGRSGRGPKEFSNIVGIDKNKSFIFIADQNQAAIKVFNKEFNFINSVPAVLMIIRGLNNFVTNKRIFLPNYKRNSNYLIQTYGAMPPFRKEESFFPKLIPYGYQPMAYNRYIISANPETGTVLVAYPGLPYLFLFDQNLNHIYTIKINSDYYEKIDNPPVEPVKRSRALGVKWYFSNVYLLDNESILFTIKKTLFHLRPFNNGYELINKYMFLTSEDTLNVGQVSVANNNLYIISSFNGYIYEIPLKKLRNN